MYMRQLHKGVCGYRYSTAHNYIPSLLYTALYPEPTTRYWHQSAGVYVLQFRCFARVQPYHVLSLRRPVSLRRPAVYGRVRP
jgi:hypothetical protein